MTGTDRCSGPNRDSFIEMMATYLGIPNLFFPIPVTVYCTTGEGDELPAAEVTATDFHQFLI